MAELVDALGSGPSGGNTVEVRVLFWAPNSEGPHTRTFFFSARRKQRACPLFVSLEYLPCPPTAKDQEKALKTFPENQKTRLS
jgi:hypothetical protein